MATCTTRERYVVCDHTKLGKPQGWKGVTIKDLASRTGRAVILTSVPAEDEPEETHKSFNEQVDAFRQLIGTSEFKDTPISLRCINLKGEVDQEITSESVRTAKKSRSRSTASGRS